MLQKVDHQNIIKCYDSWIERGTLLTCLAPTRRPTPANPCLPRATPLPVSSYPPAYLALPSLSWPCLALPPLPARSATHRVDVQHARPPSPPTPQPSFDIQPPRNNIRA
eukprot:3212330-Rhodomonas_salina.2